MRSLGDCLFSRTKQRMWNFSLAYFNHIYTSYWVQASSFLYPNEFCLWGIFFVVKYFITFPYFSDKSRGQDWVKLASGSFPLQTALGKCHKRIFVGTTSFQLLPSKFCHPAWFYWSSGFEPKQGMMQHKVPAFLPCSNREEKQIDKWPSCTSVVSPKENIQFLGPLIYSVGEILPQTLMPNIIFTFG